jgi:hypothetical protein
MERESTCVLEVVLHPPPIALKILPTICDGSKCFVTDGRFLPKEDICPVRVISVNIGITCVGCRRT